MFQPSNSFSCFVLVNPVVIWNSNFDFELYSHAGITIIFDNEDLLLYFFFSKQAFLKLTLCNNFESLVTSTFQ